MTQPTGDHPYALFPAPEDLWRYPLSGIILNDPSLAGAINTLKAPDEKIWNAIWVREFEPGDLTCQLLEQAYKIQSLNLWLQSKIPLDWLSRDNRVGRASRMLLEKEFDEERFRSWLQTKPQRSLITLVLRSDPLKGRQLSDDTLKLLDALPLDMLAAQSIKHFPWRRLQGLKPALRNPLLETLNKKLIHAQEAPSELFSLAQKVKTTNGRRLYIELLIGIQKPGFMAIVTRLLTEELQENRVSIQLIRQHLDNLLQCDSFNAEDLEACRRLMLQPSIQWEEGEFHQYDDLFLDRLFESFFSNASLIRRVEQIHKSLAMSVNQTPSDPSPLDNAQKEIPIEDYRMHAPSLIAQAAALISSYAVLNPWINVQDFQERIGANPEPLPETAIHLIPSSKQPLPLLKRYIRKLCTYQSPSEPMQWVLSLFAIHTLHAFISAHRDEAPFVDGMLEEIFLRSPLKRDPHQGLLEKALKELPVERTIDAPRIRLIQSLREQAAQAPVKVLTMLNRLMENPRIGAIHLALHLCNTHRGKMKPADESRIRAAIIERLKAHLTQHLQTLADFVHFSIEFPSLAIYMKMNLADLPADKEIYLTFSLIEMIQEILKQMVPQTGKEHTADLKLVLQGLECLYRKNSDHPDLHLLMEPFTQRLLNFLLHIWKRIQTYEHPEVLNEAIDISRKLLKNLPIEKHCPDIASELWLMVRLILLRNILTDSKNDPQKERQAAALYAESKPALFHAVSEEVRGRVDSQFSEFQDIYGASLVHAHQQFVRQIHPPLDPAQVAIRIENLTNPDDDLVHALSNAQDEQSLLLLAQKVFSSGQVHLLGWILSHLWRRLSGTDELGAVLRAACKKAPIDLTVDGYLLEWICTTPPLNSILEVLNARAYPDLLLENLRAVLYRSSSSTDLRHRYFRFFQHQKAAYFPWGWIAQTMPSPDVLQTLSPQILERESLPPGLTHYLSTSAPLKKWLNDIHHPYPILSELIQLEADFKKHAKKPPLPRAIEQIKKLLASPEPSFASLNSAFRLMLAPASLKMAGYLDLFGKLVDRTLQQIVKPHEGFQILCERLAELHRSFNYDPIIGKGNPFTAFPSKMISLAHIFYDSERTFYHYYLPNAQLAPEVKALFQKNIGEAPQDGIKSSICLDFNPNIHGELEWVFLERLFALKLESDAVRLVFNFYIRSWLHQYALNHTGTHHKRVVWGNDQLYFRSALKQGTGVDLERVAYTAFPIERTLFRKPGAGVLERQMLIQNLVTATTQELDDYQNGHTEPLHQIFLQMIRTATPDALEAVERIRHDINLSSLNETHWDQEEQETVQAFKASIVPLMRQDNIPDLFSSRPYLFQLAVKQAAQFAEPMLNWIYSGVSQFSADNLDPTLRQIYQLGQSQPGVQQLEAYRNSVTIIATRMISDVQDDFEILRSFHHLVHSSPALETVSPPLFAEAYFILTTALATKVLDPKPSMAIQWERRMNDHLDKAKVEALRAAQQPLLPRLSDLSLKFDVNSTPYKKLTHLMDQLR